MSRGLEYLDTIDSDDEPKGFQKIKRGKKYSNDEIPDRKVRKKKTQPMHQNRRVRPEIEEPSV